jgi:hypothetical protein
MIAKYFSRAVEGGGGETEDKKRREMRESV